MSAAFNELRKFVAPEILFGQGALNSVSSYVRKLGGEQILFVSDKGLEAAGWTEKVENDLRASAVSYTRYFDVTPNPRDFEVESGYNVYQSSDCDMIVALGGGSAIDCAKGIGILVSNKGEIKNYEGADNVPKPMPPLICIPTTAGSSADVSQFSIISNTKDLYKMAIVSKSIVPDISLIDPGTTVTMNSALTAETGLDALTHAIEAYVSNAASPITDMNALQAVKLILQSLPEAVSDPLDIDARNSMMLGSLFAGMAFSNASLGLVHSMAHALGGLLDLPHGLCNALLLEHVVRFNFSAAADKYRDIAKVISGKDLIHQSDEEVAEYLFAALSEFREHLSVRERLDPGVISYTALKKLADKAMNDACLVTNPRAPGQKDILDIYGRII